MRPTAHVWTCGADLIEVLAEKVLSGFPLPGGTAEDLSRYTILVPTRRAARALEEKLFALCKRKALLLPRVRPIGDSDEELIAEQLPDERLPDAISRTGQLFLMLTLIDEWARDNPHLPLADDVNASRSQALGLAESLVELVAQLETEEVQVNFGSVFADLDLAEHRLTIISLLDLVQEQLPKRLHELGLMGPAARRNAVLRMEAKRIADGGETGPIIAAGSTGTNPATRALLKAIANHPKGAVVLPGLDLGLDDESWTIIGPGHPQHAMKILLADFEIARAHVQELAPETARQTLLREVMRPAETTDKWSDHAMLPAGALQGLKLIEAPDRQLEARTIALLLRETLETPGKTAALVTPDRDLGQQVTAELLRWNAAIDDSGGEPLIRFGRAQLCKLLIDCLEDDFAPAAVVALLAHPAVSLGLEPATARGLAHLFEFALLRQDLPPQGPADFAAACQRMRKVIAADPHALHILKEMDDAAWAALGDFTLRLAAALTPLISNGAAALADHVARLNTCLEALAPARHEADPVERAFAAVMEAMRLDSSHHPVGSLQRACSSIVWALQQETLRRIPGHTRLSIYGLAEARMIDADLMVLGGLNESIWPALVDPGPWVNRSMRTTLALAQPERDIGITAHDFVQNLLHKTVVATWSKRVGTTPVMPSRWVLRLRALLEAGGIDAKAQLAQSVLHLAADIDRPQASAPITMPRPKPDAFLRPRSFSVTEIEKLIRDPYAIFARRVLELEALPSLGTKVEPSLRGMMFHEALSRYVQENAHGLPELLAIGEAVFASSMNHPEVRHFWWPRFKRMARAFIEEDARLMADVAARLVERSGHVLFTIDGIEHKLRARADRLDVTGRGRVRFIDYKTGSVPTSTQVETGLNPQLTLEAAILMHGSFGDTLPGTVDDLLYIQISGGKPPVEVTSLTKKFDVTEVANTHFARLKGLLGRYQEKDQAYLPRAVIFKERDSSDYDHLSRYAEWSRGGT